MNLKEALKIADRIIFEKTGQHLDDLPEAVLKGTLEHETHKHIAKEFDCSQSNVRQIGSESWQILSEEFGEDVSKTNFRSAMQRFQISKVSNFVQDVQDFVALSSFNTCGEARDYRSLFKQIEKLSHQSCWEHPGCAKASNG